MSPILSALGPAERRALRRLFVAASALGACIAATLILAAEAVQTDSSLWWGLVGLGLLGAMVLLQQGVIPARTAEVIKAIADRRLEVFARLCDTDLRTIESMPEVESQVARDFTLLDQLPSRLSAWVSLVVSVGVVTAYIYALSAAAGLVWTLILAGLLAMNHRLEAGLNEAIPRRAGAHGALATDLRARLDGFAQLLFDAPARAEGDAVLRTREDALRQSQAEVDEAESDFLTWGEDVVMLALAVIIFRMAGLADLEPSILYRLSTVVLATSGFLLGIVSLTGQLRIHSAGLARLHALEGELGPADDAPLSAPLLPAGPGLRLGLRKLGFTYREGGFSVGPVDLDLRGGQLVMIRGGNGCGKTTLMKTIAGLYPPTRGGLRLGDRAIGPEDEAWYRAHVSAIFTGQHLFDRPYGLDVEPAEMRAMLARFGLEHATQVRDGRFTRTRLSSGQSKRLAMCVALLEKRPILLLDEWDSHQDPGLRRFYYEELLPELTAQGKLVIVVSHDERRFGLADVLLHLEGGQVVSAARRGDAEA